MVKWVLLKLPCLARNEQKSSKPQFAEGRLMKSLEFILQANRKRSMILHPFDFETSSSSWVTLVFLQVCGWNWHVAPSPLLKYLGIFRRYSLLCTISLKDYRVTRLRIMYNCLSALYLRSDIFIYLLNFYIGIGCILKWDLKTNLSCLWCGWLEIKNWPRSFWSPLLRRHEPHRHELRRHEPCRQSWTHYYVSSMELKEGPKWFGRHGEGAYNNDK